MTPLVGGLSVGMAHEKGVLVPGGGVWSGTTPILNAYVCLGAEPDSNYFFVGWDDGTRRRYRRVRATGEAKRYVAMFEHKAKGTWEGNQGSSYRRFR